MRPPAHRSAIAAATVLLVATVLAASLGAPAPARADGWADVHLADPNGRLYGPNYPFPSTLVDQNGNPTGVSGDELHVTVDGGSTGGSSSTPTGTPNDGKTASTAVPVMGIDDKALASQATLQLILNALGGGAAGVLAVPLVTLGAAPAAGSSVVPTSDVADGTAISAATMPAGGQGLLGWLSALWQAATGYLKTTLYVGQTQVGPTAPVPTQGVDLPIASQSSVATQTLSGTPTAATSTNSYTFQTGGMGTISLDLSGITASGAAVTFYASDSGIRFYPVNTLNGAPNNRNSSTTADGSYTFPIAGRRAIRVAITTAGSSGTLAVVGDASPSSRVVDIDSSPTAPVSDQLIAGGLVVGSTNGSTLVGLPTTDTQDGVANTQTGAATLAGNGSGLLGWLSTIASDFGLAQTSTGAPTNPGSGLLGWVSGIYKALTSPITTGNITVSASPTPPAVTASAYSAGMEVGAYTPITGFERSTATGMTVQKILLELNDTQVLNMDAVIFFAPPTATTFTDHAALSISPLDQADIAGVIPITDCHSLGTPTECQAVGQQLSITVPTAGAPLGMVLVARSAFTPGSTNEIQAERIGGWSD